VAQPPESYVPNGFARHGDSQPQCPHRCVHTRAPWEHHRHGVLLLPPRPTRLHGSAQGAAGGALVSTGASCCGAGATCSGAACGTSREVGQAAADTSSSASGPATRRTPSRGSPPRT
jgi:hypothetical protein